MLFHALGVGVWIGLDCGLSAHRVVLVGCLLWGGLAGVSLFVRRRSYASVTSIGMVAVAGFARAALETGAIPPSDLSLFDTGKEAATVSGLVISPVENRESGGRFGLRVTSVTVRDTTFAVTGGILVSCRDFVPGLVPGDGAQLRGSIRLPEPARNPGGFDYRAYLAGLGYSRTTHVRRPSDLVRLSTGGTPLEDLVVTPLRRHVRSSIRSNLSGTPAALLEGVLLGDKSQVPDSIREAFSRSGVSHVLAVSGLHVGLVAAGAFFLTRAMGAGQVGGSVLTSLCVWTYALITGLPASVIRASCVACLVVWARCLRLRMSGLNALGVAGVMILVVRPMELHGLGFQLSFAATAGILLLHRPLTDLLASLGGRRWRTWLAVPVAVSVAAQLATAPIIVTAFGQLSVVATAANLIVVPLLSASVGIGLLTVLGAAVHPMIATVLNGTNWVTLSAGAWVAEFCARPDWAAITLVAPSAASLVVFACALLAIVESVRTSRWGGVVVLVGLTAANIQVWSSLLPSHHVVMRVLDVGQGDGILISFPNGKHMLVDGGIAGFGEDAGERVVLPALRHLGISRIDVVVASHPHADHVGGLVTVMQKVDVGHYVESGQRYGTWTAGRIRKLIRERGIVRHTVAAGDSISGFGEAQVVVLHPRPEYVNPVGKAPHGLNNGSVVIKVTYRGQSILLTGDIEHETDGALLAWGNRLKTTVLKSAHHGSKTSSTDRFLGAVDPGWIAVSCGIDNKFRHPSPVVLERYARMGVKLSRTDLEGCVTYRISEEGVEVSGFLGGSK